MYAKDNYKIYAQYNSSCVAYIKIKANQHESVIDLNNLIRPNRICNIKSLNFKFNYA